MSFSAAAVQTPPRSPDDRAAKRVHRAEPESPRELGTTRMALARAAADPTFTGSNRRKSSSKDLKAPLGPRPQLSASKRVASEANTRILPLPTRQALPNTTSEPFLGLSARRTTNHLDNAPAIAYREKAPERGMNAGASSGEEREGLSTALNRLRNTTSEDNDAVETNSPLAPSPSVGAFLPPVGISAGSRPFMPSPTRPPNTALKAAQLSAASALTSSASVSANTRARRQSQFPLPSSNKVEPPSPRKSIGPGMVFASLRDAPSESLLQSTLSSQKKEAPRVVRQISNPKAKPRLSTAGSSSKLVTTAGDSGDVVEPNASLGEPELSGTPRSQPTQEKVLARNMDTEPPAITARNFSRHPSMEPPSLPLSTRKSIIGSNHSSNMLARTVSPTDVRRLRRQSEVKQPLPFPTPPPIPLDTPPTKQPHYSPPPARQKSATPSSSRATPEVSHRLSSGRPLSSRSSYCSVRPPSSSQQNRNSTLTQPTKASAAKARNVHSSAGQNNETVPPVPAIPKAYESPRDVVEEPFFHNVGKRDSDAQAKSSQNIPLAENVKPKTAPPLVDVNSTQSAQKSSSTLVQPNKLDGSKSTATQPSLKQAQGATRLPPLNLFPLGSSTSKRIASMAPTNTDGMAGKTTPPPKRNLAKTPSTPMTASKATFSHDYQNMYDATSTSQARSSTAYGLPRAETPPEYHSGSSSPANFVTPSPSTSRRRHSPPNQSSSRKASIDQKPIPVREDSQRVIADQMQASPASETKPAKTSTFRKRAMSKLGRENSNEAKEVEPTPTSATTTKRKLSLGWRRSSSKASVTRQAQPAEEVAFSARTSTDMPPPKFPASAVWKSASARASPSASSQWIKETEFKKLTVVTDGSSPAQRPELVQRSSASEQSSIPESPLQGPISAKTSSSILSPMQKMLGSKSTPITPKTAQPESAGDHDIIAADAEMKRLAGKKKEFETSAKELEELTKRAVKKASMSPGQAARTSNLNIFERGEIIDYNEIFFCGTKSAKKFVGDLASQSANFGFDDERGDYNIVLGDHLAYRYEIIDILGKGSFGQVVRCIDYKTGGLVAVKIIRNKKRFHQQALVEVNILQKLREWDPQNTHSMVNFTQSFYFRGHLCIATELLGINLYEFIKAHEFRGFTLKLIRRFTRQILSSLCILQHRKVIHCDLKPENILLAHPLRSEIKVIDFGSSCFETEKVYTYIQSRFYRSPEVILGMDYGLPIDMWSMGCILAELLTGYPIFPGENEQEQLACIMEVFGPPEKHLIEKSTRKKLFFDSMGKPRPTVSSKGKRRRPNTKTLRQALKCDDEAFLDFIARCLRWDPERRLQPEEAMQHEFVTGMKKRPVRLQTNVMSAAAIAASPAKRHTMQPPAKARPLPEPPTPGLKTSGVPISREPSSSPVKGGAVPRRHSTMNGLSAGAGVKRNSNGTAINSALPRVTQPRTVSGKTDLASAAARLVL